MWVGVRGSLPRCKVEECYTSDAVDALCLSSRFPGSRVKALSNSNQQREYIEEQARERGITNLKVFTGDVAKVGQTNKYNKQSCK